MNPQEQYRKAKDAGYSDQEILSFLDQHPVYGVKNQQARDAGYSDAEIMQFMSGAKAPEQQKERGPLEQVGRLALQGAVGYAEINAIPYDIAASGIELFAPGATDASDLVKYRQNLMDDLEQMMFQKQTGVWNDQDQAQLDNVLDLIKNPQKGLNLVKEAKSDLGGEGVGVQGLFEKALNVDLKPEGFAEKAVRWTAWVRNPKNLAKVASEGISAKQFIKNLMPTGKEAFRGTAAATALQLAEENEIGPIGTILAAVAADASAGGLANLIKKGGAISKASKREMAETIARQFTDADKREIQQQLIKGFRDSGIQADLGTITDNNLIKAVQTKLAQSGLTGEAFDNLKQQITEQAVSEYKQIGKSVGDLRFQTNFNAGESLVNNITNARNQDLQEVRNIYKSADKALGEEAKTVTQKLASSVNKLISDLEPGAIKSGEQKAVLDAANKLKNDLLKAHPKGNTAYVKDLMNNKIALNDIINYEVQGGAKQLLKGIVGELDRAIIQHGNQNKQFAKLYVDANKRFSQHAKTFRNKGIGRLIRIDDPVKALASMNSVQGIRSIEKALSISAQGRKTFNDLKRFKLEELIGKNMIDSTTGQLKYGTFSKLLQKGQNREIVRELLGPRNFKRLELLQKNAGKLADSSNKFFNSSQSATSAFDTAAIVKLFKDLSGVLSGNVWSLTRTGGLLIGSRKAAQLMTDPEFLRLVEEAIIHQNAGRTKQLNLTFEQMLPYAQVSKSELMKDRESL